MPTPYDALEIVLQGTAYAGQTDAQILTEVNAATVSVMNDVPAARWNGYLGSYGFTIPLQAYAGLNGRSPPAGASTLSIQAAEMAMLMLNSPGAFPVVALTNPVTLAELTAMLNAFVAEGNAGRLVSLAGTPFSQTNMNDLLALGTTTISIGAQCGFTKPVLQDDLTAARDPNRGAAANG